MIEISKTLYEKYKSIMPDPETFIEISNQPLPFCFWVNTNRTKLNSVESFLEARKIQAKKLQWNNEAFEINGKVNLGNTSIYVLGHIHIQEAVSMVPGYIANLLKPKTVLDMCAAPGNKAAQIGVNQSSNSLLIANEPFMGRHSSLRSNLNRLGVSSVIYTKYDGASFPILESPVDLVMCDVPCSCEGTLRKSKTIKLNEAYSQKLAQTQLGILKRALRNTKVGGHVIYSTCTFNPVENEGVIQRLIESEPKGKFSIVETGIPNLFTSPGLTSWQNTKFDKQISKTMRLWPQQNNSGGFYVAVLEKNSD